MTPTTPCTQERARRLARRAEAAEREARAWREAARFALALHLHALERIGRLQAAADERAQARRSPAQARRGRPASARPAGARLH